jgi:hypothetical protein
MIRHCEHDPGLDPGEGKAIQSLAPPLDCFGGFAASQRRTAICTTT